MIKEYSSAEPGRLYVEFSGVDLRKLEQCARFRDEPDLARVLAQLIDDEIADKTCWGVTDKGEQMLRHG
jgi:hypothetical protein